MFQTVQNLFNISKEIFKRIFAHCLFERAIVKLSALKMPT